MRFNNSARKLIENLLTLSVSCFAGMGLMGAEASGLMASLRDTSHTDGRNTPKLVFPAAAESKVGNNRQGAEQFLKSRQAEFRLPPDLSNLELVSARESLLGTHYRYRQMLNGIPVEGAEVVVSITRDGQVYQSFNNTYPVETPPLAAKASISQEHALDIAWDHLRVHGKLLHVPNATVVYLPSQNGFRLAYKTLVGVAAPAGHWEHKIDAVSGEILAVRDTRVSKNNRPEKLPNFAEYTGPVWSRAQETQELESTLAAAKSITRVNKNVVDGTARVFDSDPRTYLANASLTNSSVASAFNNAYVTRTLRDISELNGVYSLEGPWVRITDWDPPSTRPSTTANGQWTASRGNNAFNDAMTYFHIDQNQRYLQSLGYIGATGIQNGPIDADSDGAQGDDNSYYFPGANQLAFGHGDVDDNEDADVILHEYGHAITYDIVPSWGGGDTGAIGEGFGDYWGGSYSSTTVNGRTFRPGWAFSWDGHSADSWVGRFLDKTNLTYDPTHTYDAHQDLNGVQNYSDQLWSAPLWAAFQALTGTGYARTNVDKIIIESFFGIGGNPTMRDLAYATVNAADLLFPSGPYATVFSQRFMAQNILPPAAVPAPAFVVPAGNDTFVTGSVAQIVWNRNGAPSDAAARLEYSSGVLAEFLDTAENGVNNWVATHSGGTRNWSQVTTASHSPTHSWFATNQTTATDQFLRSPRFTVVPGSVLSFWHRYNLELDFDGGVVEISANGNTWTDLGSLSTKNGYVTTISYGYNSPIAGRMAFTGNSGTFIETQIPLTAYAGQNVYLRFRAASDASDAATGWWVDDVKITNAGLWTSLGVAPAGASSYDWRVPMVPGTNYALLMQQFASGYSDSDWVQSARFSVGFTVPRPVIQSLSLNGGTATITWGSVPSTTYRVQFSNNAQDTNWTTLAPDVVASGTTSTKVDQPLAPQRFYRVMVP